MSSESIKPIYKLNSQVLDILKKARNLIDEDPQKASDMLDVSIKTISNIYKQNKRRAYYHSQKKKKEDQEFYSSFYNNEKTDRHL